MSCVVWITYRTKREASLLHYKQYSTTPDDRKSVVHGNMQYHKSVFTVKSDGVELREDSGNNVVSGSLTNGSVIMNVATVHCSIKKLAVPLFLSRGYASEKTNCCFRFLCSL